MWTYLLYFVSMWIFANGINWHASQITLRHLYNLQNEQFDVVKNYVKLETKRLHDLESFLASVVHWHKNNTNLKNTYSFNHLNYILLTKQIYDKRLTATTLLTNEHSLEAFKQFDENKRINDFNMQSMCRALRRLQKVYAIPASEMASGEWKARIIGDPINACECYVMSKYSFKDADMFGVMDWGVQAYNKWLVDRPTCLDIDKLLYYIKRASMTTGFNFQSLSNIEKIDLSKSSDNFVEYMHLMESEMFIQDIKSQLDIYETYNMFEYYDSNKNFRQLCRTGLSKQPLRNYLKCRYQTKNSFYRILMPFKEEDISNDPYVKLYHELIFDGEIKTILDLAEKNLSDAKFYVNGKADLIDDRRLGQLKWFSESMHPKLFDRLNNRIECLTEFTTRTAEEYQTVNYGAGGHFSVHYDAFTDGPKLQGNRLITILFYMTDVFDDGYTVFPNLNYVAHCVKGTALMWQNLYLNNGSIHSGTYHGGCPIIKGNKWIMTKGLYEGGQPLLYDWRKNKNIIIV